MDGELYFTLQVDTDTTLSIGPIADCEIEASGECVVDRSGYFLLEKKRTDSIDEVRIIARLSSQDAAIELGIMLNMR